MSNNQIKRRGKNMLAKPVVKNKFWVVTDDEGDQIATIQKLNTNDKSKSVVFVSNKKRTTFPSIKVLGEKHNIKIGRTVTKPAEEPTDSVYGYPADGEVFNVVYDVPRGLPLYTKLEASKSFFCAGYYIISFSGAWVKNFCPKLLTLDRNDYQGPFRTEDEMKARLAEVRK
jgi:hypothetical protein